MVKRVFAPLLAALFFVSFFGTLAGCNTVEGAGKDIQQGGQAITDEAKEKKQAVMSGCGTITRSPSSTRSDLQAPCAPCWVSTVGGNHWSQVRC